MEEVSFSNIASWNPYTREAHFSMKYPSVFHPFTRDDKFAKLKPKIRFAQVLVKK